MTEILLANLTDLTNVVPLATQFPTTTGSANAQTASYSVPLPTQPAGMQAGYAFALKAGFSNNGATTLTVVCGGTSYGPFSVLRNGAALSSGDLQANGAYIVIYNGTAFDLFEGGQSVNAANIISGTLSYARFPSFAHVESDPTAPASTASAAGVMMGLGVTITPVVSGKVLISLQGVASNSVSGGIWFVRGRYGTGTAPANGAAVSGTPFGVSIQEGTSATAAQPGSFNLSATVTGLALGTPVWIDGVQGIANSGTTSIAAVHVSATELP